MKCFVNRKEQGFTIVELLISMAIGLVMTTALSSTFLLQHDAYDAQNQLIDVVQITRATLDMMSREIRMAGYNPLGAAFIFNGVTYNTDELRVRMDLDGDGSTTSNNEDITYRYYPSDYQIMRRSSSSGSFEPFADNIHAFIFEYLDEYNNPTIVSTDIRQIRLTITTKNDQRTRTYGYQDITISSRIQPRNLGYPGGTGFSIS